MKKTRVVSADWGKLKDGAYTKTWLWRPSTSLDRTFVLDSALDKHILNIYAATAFIERGSLSDGTELIVSTEYKKPTWNTILHTKSGIIDYPFGCACRNKWSTTYWTIRGSYRYGDTLTYSIPAVPTDKSWVDDSWRDEAYWTMRPRFEGEVSMLNFLYELKDFREMADYICHPTRLTKVMTSVRNFRSKLATLRENSNSSAIGAVNTASKRIAEGHLINAFLVQPLISDISDIIWQAQQTVREAEMQFYLRSARKNTRHVTKHGPELLSLGAWSTYRSRNDWGLKAGTRLTRTWTASMDFTFKYQCRNRLDAFMTYWGLTPTAEACWNALPFSFLIDYIFSIGQSLHTMRTDPNVSDFHVSQYCESVAIISTSGHHIVPGSDPGYIDHQFMVDNKYQDSGTCVRGARASYYERVVKDPVFGPVLPKFKVPKTSQAINTLALARCLL